MQLLRADCDLMIRASTATGILPLTAQIPQSSHRHAVRATKGMGRNRPDARETVIPGNGTDYDQDSNGTPV